MAVYDGFEKATNRKVQIKATFKNYCYFPFGDERIPDYFLSINILENGEIEELYNGPGKYLVDNYILKNNLKHYKESYYTLSKGKLRKLNSLVPIDEKIKIIEK